MIGGKEGEGGVADSGQTKGWLEMERKKACKENERSGEGVERRNQERGRASELKLGSVPASSEVFTQGWRLLL